MIGLPNNLFGHARDDTSLFLVDAPREILRKCRVSSFFALLVFGMLPTSPLADGGDLYIGLGPSFSFLDPETTDTSFTVEDDTDVGGKVFLGYDFIDWLSLEGFYGIPGSADIASGGATVGSIDYDGVYGLGLVLTFPDNVRGFNFFLKGGGAGADTSSGNIPFRKVDDIGGFGGAGFGYEFGRGWGLRLEYEYLFEDVQLATLGLTKRFGIFGKEEPQTPESPPEPQLEVVETTPGDEDEDGVADNVDRCSGTPAGTIVDEIGCEAPPALVETLEEVSLNARGLFRVNSTRVTPKGVENLREFVAKLNQNYVELKAIVVEGHTDSSGSEAYNLELARQRAEAVRIELLGAGVDPALITTESYGESRPIADNTTADGRAKNRRVELKVRAVKKTQ